MKSVVLQKIIGITFVLIPVTANAFFCGGSGSRHQSFNPYYGAPPNMPNYQSRAPMQSYAQRYPTGRLIRTVAMPMNRPMAAPGYYPIQFR